ncbi:MAG: hypothetical protein ACE5KE_08080 [Methanosarcinales archaeon]
MQHKKIELEEEPFDDPVLEARYQLLMAAHRLRRELEKEKKKKINSP